MGIMLPLSPTLERQKFWSQVRLHLQFFLYLREVLFEKFI